MNDPEDLKQLFFIMNNRDSDEMNQLTVCQKFIKRITISDTVPHFKGVVRDELLPSKTTCSASRKCSSPVSEWTECHAQCILSSPTSV